MAVLIVAPHLDDEVYGCTSFLDRNAVVFYCTRFHPGFPNNEPLVERDAIRLEARLAVLDAPLYWMTNRLDTIPTEKMVAYFEQVINEVRPDTILLPAPSYNQDHRAVLDAALIAVRPHDQIHFVKCVLLYEQPETFGTLRKPQPFNPTYFRPLDIVFKRKLYEIYWSQSREHRSLERIRAIAKVRGMQANMEYAEAFEVLRWVE